MMTRRSGLDQTPDPCVRICPSDGRCVILRSRRTRLQGTSCYADSLLCYKPQLLCTCLHRIRVIPLFKLDTLAFAHASVRQQPHYCVPPLAIRLFQLVTALMPAPRLPPRLMPDIPECDVAHTEGGHALCTTSSKCAE